MTQRLIKQWRHKRKHYDLPLQRGSGGKLVTWIVGVMTYLTILFLVLNFGLLAVKTYWTGGIAGKMTLEIAYDRTNPVNDATVKDMVTQLNDLRGVTAHPLGLDEIGQLVGPWLGEGTALSDLPLPTLIDVTRDAHVKNAVSNDAIAKTAQRIIPRATLDTHQEWLSDIMKLAETISMILIALALILGITAAVTVAATARTRLALHRDEVDLLHLIGATDSYIATQFQRQAFRLATEGAALGLLAAMITLAVIAIVKNKVGDGIIPGIDLTAIQWSILCLMPLVAGLIAMITSRFTVLRALKAMP